MRAESGSLNNKLLRELNFFKVIALLCSLGFLAYFNAIFHPFVHDDLVFIQNNPHLSQWTDLGDIFFNPLKTGTPETIVNFYYRPILEVIYKFQYLLFGMNPSGFHFFNILIHLMNGILVYRILSFLFGRPQMALAVAIVFIVHPVQSEAVAAVVGISNLLVSLFCLLSFLFYVIWDKQDQRHKPVRLVLSLVLFICGLLTKEQAVIVPVLILLYEFFMEREDPSFFIELCTANGNKSKETKRKIDCLNPIGKEKVNRKRAAGSVGFFILLGFYLGFRYFFLKPAALGIDQEFILRILSIPSTLLMYLGILVFPVDLHYYRCTDILAGWVFPMLRFALLLGGIFILFRFMPKAYWRILGFAAGWFLVCLLPVLNIFPLINEYSLILTAEHFLYLPLIGFALFVFVVIDYFLQSFLKEKSRSILFVIFCVLIVLYTGLTVKQNRYWRGEIPLFERAVVFENHFGRLHLLLARAYYFDRQIDTAIDEYHKALDIMNGYLKKVQNPRAREFYLQFVQEIHFDLAHCYEAKDDINFSINEYRKVLELNPQDSVTYNNIGSLYTKMKKMDLAQEYFEKALSLDSRNVLALSNLAICYIERQDKARARNLLTQALAIDPGFVPAKQNLERLLMEKP